MKYSSFFKNCAYFALLLFCFIFLNVATKAPLSISLYVALLYSLYPSHLSAIALTLSFLVYKDLTLFLCGAVSCLVLGSAFLIFKKNKKLPGAEIVLFIVLSLVPYLVFSKEEILNKVVYTFIIAVFSFPLTSCVRSFKRLKIVFRATFEEWFSFSVFLIVLGVGIINFYNDSIYFSLSIFALLYGVKTLKNERSLFLAIVLATPLFITSGLTHYFLTYACYFLITKFFMEKSKILSSLLIIGIDFSLKSFLPFFSGYSYFDLALTAIPAVIFAIIPTSFFDNLSQKFDFSPSDVISRLDYNNLRFDLADKFFNLANLFCEIKTGVSLLKSNSDDRQTIINGIITELKNSVCQTCAHREYCPILLESHAVLYKVVEIGVCKKRITLIDLSKEFLDYCKNPKPIIYEVNRLIEGLSANLQAQKDADEIKEVLLYLAHGLEEFSKNQAFGLTKKLSLNKKAEKLIKNYLISSSIDTAMVTFYENDKDTEILIAFNAEKVTEQKLCNMLSAKLGFPLSVTHTAHLPDKSCLVTLKSSPNVNLAWGSSKATKMASSISGDTYSIVKLDQNKVLIALADGMGSGSLANNLSTASIELIEAFYKAGFPSEILLPVINKLLSITTEDNFSAIDVAVLDINQKTCDFIKIGAPYGFICSKEGIKLLEGSSLPLGILDALKPTTATTSVLDGDTIVMISDGISEAFTSSTDFIEFLKTAPIYNPQALADSIVNKALDLSSGIAEDDMTAFCVRIFSPKENLSA